jgi:hypothetical protein
MLDDLRNSSSFEEEEEPLELEEEELDAPSSRGYRRKEPFLGMTAPQRFVISLMLFIMTCVVGVLALVILEKIYLPFF